MFVWIKRGFLPLAILGLLFTGAAQAQNGPPDRIKVLIGFDRTPGAADEALVRGLGGSVKYRYHLVPAIAASIPENAMAALLRSPRVTSVTLDGTVQAIDHELANTWGVERVGAGEVHIGGNMGAGVSVAVIDTGIDYSHPELIGPYMGGEDFVNDDGDPMDDNGHGTHVSGTIAATIAAVDDHTGVVGMAPGVSLYGLKVLSASGSGYWSDIIAALQWAVVNGIDITNNSYGSSGNPGPTVEQAFINSSKAGVLHIAAAGNTGNCGGKGNNVGYPARYASVVAVAATNSSDKRPCFSSTGPDVELAAPGVYIRSTVPGGGYAVWSGTSMASPHVAGAAALIIASSGDPLSNDDIRQRLADTAIDLGATGRDNRYGYGLIDVVAATAESGLVNLPPTVSMTNPNENDIFVGQDVLVAADVWDDLEGVQVEFFVDSVSLGTPTNDANNVDSWSIMWKATAACNGSHNVLAKATDSSNQTAVESVGVTVSNDPDICADAGPGPLEVTEIDLNVMIAGTDLDVTVSGAGFADGATLTFEGGKGSAPTATNVVVVGETTLMATVRSKAKGKAGDQKFDVVVTNLDGSSASLSGGFTLTRY